MKDITDLTSRVPVPVEPDAARVWRGFRRPGLVHAEFLKKIASLFAPATPLFQRPLGLTAYLPAMLPKEKPDGLPDEIALVYYESQDVYRQARTFVGGQLYADIHDLVFFREKNLSGSPLKFSGALEPNSAVFHFDSAADWQLGASRVSVVARPSGLDGEAYYRQVAEALRTLAAQKPAGIDAAVTAVADAYVVHWEHWTSRESLAAAPAASVESIGPPVLSAMAHEVVTPPSFAARLEDLPFVEHPFLNVLFRRRSE